MNKKIVGWSILFLGIIWLSNADAGERDFINQTDTAFEITVNGLKCLNYPPQFSNCEIEKQNQVITLLKPKQKTQIQFRHYLLGEIKIKDVATGKLLDDQIRLTENGEPELGDFNSCMAIVLKSVNDGKINYQFDGCLQK